MESKNLCPICGEGHLTTNSAIETREFNGFSGDVTIHYSTCNACGCDTATDQDMKLNLRAMNAFKKKALGLLSGSEILEIRNKLGISQKEASIIFGGGPTAFTKYENDDVIQSIPMNNNIILAHKSSDAFSILCQRQGIKIEPVASLKPVNRKSNLLSNTPLPNNLNSYFVLHSSSESNQYNEKAEYH